MKLFSPRSTEGEWKVRRDDGVVNGLPKPTARPMASVVVMWMVVFGVLDSAMNLVVAAAGLQEPPTSAAAPAEPDGLGELVPAALAPPSLAPDVALDPTPPSISRNLAGSELIPDSSNVVIAPGPTEYEQDLATARRLRAEGKTQLARVMLVDLIESGVPSEIEGEALLELGLVAEDQSDWQRALEIYNQYRDRFPDSLAAPKILLRQGLLYRQMGASGSALSKFYAVMSTAIAIKDEDFAAYERLVLQAQTEIADTHFLLGKYAEAADFFRRLLRQSSPFLSVSIVRFKLIQSLAAQGLHEEAVAEATTYLAAHPGTKDESEVRFLLSTSLKALGRNQDALQQVMLLLSIQRRASGGTGPTWIDWQRRAGNQIANQLYMEGDFVNALEIYLGLSLLDASLAWQVPIWYQAGLIYERLGQPEMAHKTYERILAREKDLPATGSEGVRSVIEMTKWRKDFLGWHAQTLEQNHDFKPTPTNTFAK